MQRWTIERRCVLVFDVFSARRWRCALLRSQGRESLVAPSWRSEFWQMQRATPISSGALLGMRNHSFAARKGWVKHSGPIFGHKGVLASCCDEAREEAS